MRFRPSEEPKDAARSPNPITSTLIAHHIVVPYFGDASLSGRSAGLVSRMTATFPFIYNYLSARCKRSPSIHEYGGFGKSFKQSEKCFGKNETEWDKWTYVDAVDSVDRWTDAGSPTIDAYQPSSFARWRQPAIISEQAVRTRLVPESVSAWYQGHLQRSSSKVFRVSGQAETLWAGRIV